MSKVLAWVKSNPLMLVAAAFCLLAVIAMVFVHSWGQSLTERMQQRGRDVANISNLLRTPVPVPSDSPDTAPETRQITVTAGDLDNLSAFYKEVGKQTTEISSFVIQFNQGNHGLLMPAILPNPADSAVRFDIKGIFRQSIAAMLGGPSRLNGEVGLDAGLPPPQIEITRAVERASKEFVASLFSGMAGMTDADAERLNRIQVSTALKVLTDRARSIHIYADTTPLGGTSAGQGQTGTSGFPLDVAALPDPAVDSKPATVEQIWEAHVSWWIQRDIVAAIAIANRVNDPSANVIGNPIKRILKLTVIPGYVGIDTFGAIKGPNTNIPVPAPPLGPDARIAEDFSVSPTGRVSNGLFDVRHSTLSVIADSKRLPELFDALAKTNLNTVLSVQVKPIDEYMALREGFVYGSGDAVQADLIIESLWLRQWTAPLMPESVKMKVGVTPQVPAPGLTTP